MSGPKVLDRIELCRRLGDDEEVVRLVIGTFVTDVRQLLSELRQALGAGDADAIRQLGHALRGITISVCAEAMHEVAVQIEAVGAPGDMERAASLAEGLEGEIERFIREADPDSRQGES
jgi:HPt (histidine-containing phosphotransfer) domain-containing protein